MEGRHLQASSIYRAATEETLSLTAGASRRVKKVRGPDAVTRHRWRFSRPGEKKGGWRRVGWGGVVKEREEMMAMGLGKTGEGRGGTKKRV